MQKYKNIHLVEFQKLKKLAHPTVLYSSIATLNPFSPNFCPCL